MTWVLSPLNEMSIERKVFISFAMSLEKKDRYHGNSIIKKINKGKLKIPLPINDKEKIDWKLIDEFMKNKKRNY